MLRAPGNYAETGYIDYPSQERASNLAENEIASKSVIFQHYAWNDYHYCAGPTGCKEPAGPAAAGTGAGIAMARRQKGAAYYMLIMLAEWLGLLGLAALVTLALFGMVRAITG